MKKQSQYYEYRIPPEFISYAVWLYHRRFTLSFRNIEDPLTGRGIVVTYETIHQSYQKFGLNYVKKVCKIAMSALPSFPKKFFFGKFLIALLMFLFTVSLSGCGISDEADGATPASITSDGDGSALKQSFNAITINPTVEFVKSKNVDAIDAWVDGSGETKVFITSKKDKYINRFDINGNHEMHSEKQSFTVNGLIVFENELYVSENNGQDKIRVFDPVTLELKNGRDFASSRDLTGGGEHDLDICSAAYTGGINVGWVTDDSGVVVAYDVNKGTKLYRKNSGFTKGLEEVEVIEHTRGCTVIIANENVRGNQPGFTVWDADAADATKVNDFGQGLYRDGDAEGIKAFLAGDGSGYLFSAVQGKSKTTYQVYHFDKTGSDFTHLGSFELRGVSNTDGIGGFQWAVPGNPKGMFLSIDNDSRGVGVGLHEIFNATGLSLGS